MAAKTKTKYAYISTFYAENFNNKIITLNEVQSFKYTLKAPKKQWIFYE